MRIRRTGETRGRGRGAAPPNPNLGAFRPPPALEPSDSESGSRAWGTVRAGRSGSEHDVSPHPTDVGPSGSLGRLLTSLKLWAALLAGVWGVAGGGLGAQMAPPDAEWRTIETEHFRVTFPEALEDLARRAGNFAEAARRALAEEFLTPPDGTIDILLTDHTDYPNGFAQYVPSNRITIYARPPTDLPSLGYYQDWLELVITHELAHVVHLDRSNNPIGRASRAVFGRVGMVWPFFPGATLPRWGVEGIATWYESRLTGAGRVNGSFHEAVVRTAAIEDRLEGLGDVQGNSPMWPGGQRPYAYGAQFFEYLLERFGEESMARFAEAVAGQWVPYRLNAAGKRAYGISLSQAWSDWTDHLGRAAGEFEARALLLGPLSSPEAVTGDSREALHPVFSADGLRLYYVLADGRSDPAVVRLLPQGEDRERLFRLNTTGPVSVLPSGELLFAQQDFAGPYRFVGDLYSADAASGRTRRLTSGARLSQPAAAPGGGAVAVLDGAGTRSLVRVDLESGAIGELVPPSPGEHWAFPAISPDGEWIAATRWREGLHDVVVLSSEGRIVAEVTSDRAMDLAPRWSADGRYLVWMSDRTGTFNIVGVEWDGAEHAGSPRLLTNVLSAAGYPALDPAGEWLYFSHYHADGWEIERLPFDFTSARPLAQAEGLPQVLNDQPGRAAGATNAERMAGGVGDPSEAEVEAGARRESEAGTGDLSESVDGAGDPSESVDGAGDPSESEDGTGDPSQLSEVRAYSSFATLAPTHWEPVARRPVATAAVSTDDHKIPSRQLLGWSFGLATSSTDLVQRHSYALRARLFIPEAKWEGGASYTYRGLGNPVLGFSASQWWDDDGVRLGGGGGGSPPDTLYVLERERRAAASVSFISRGARRYLSLTIDGGLVQDDFTLLDSRLDPATRYRLVRPETRRFDYSAAVQVSTARSTALQLGAYKGLSLYLRLRDRRELSLPDSLVGSVSDRSVRDLLARGSIFAPLFRAGYAQHVVAARIGLGVASGAGAHGGYFDVGGASGSPESITGLALFGGRGIFFPVRGHAEGARGGDRAWSASLEYRFPLALVNRGLGPWPAHLDRVSGTVFFDAGNAWVSSSASGPFQGAMTAAGVEVTTDVLVFYRFTTRLRSGVAVPLDDPRAFWYLRVGLPF